MNNKAVEKIIKTGYNIKKEFRSCVFLENDAITSGVARGGLISTTEIRALLCYIIDAMPYPVPGKKLADMLFFEGLANCFEVNDSIAYLEKTGHLKLYDEAEDTYVITPSGSDIAKTLKSIIPYTVKEKAYAATLKMVSRMRNAKETDIKISYHDGSAYITCTALDGEKPFMSVQLLVSDETQANLIKERFLDDPAKIYTGIIDLLTK